MSAHTTASLYREMLETVLSDDPNYGITSHLSVSSPAPSEFVMVSDSVRNVAILTPHEATVLAADLLRAAASVQARSQR